MADRFDAVVLDPPAFADRFRAHRRVSLDAGHQAMVTRPEALAHILRLEAEAPPP